MEIKGKADFISALSQYPIDTEFIIVKPNWVSNKYGEYTEPEILDWLFECFPEQKKIIVESYTPWRGLKFSEDDTHKGEGVTLLGGKNHWDFYKKQDEYFLQSTGINKIITKYKADYINITNKVWANNCVEPKIISDILRKSSKSIIWNDLLSFIPKKLVEIRNKSTLISLSKIKTEESIPEIYISMSVKNLFGLIPHPSRWIPYHENNHQQIPTIIRDIYSIYTSLFPKSLWITEGIFTLVKHYCEPNQKIIKNQNLLFIGKDGSAVDREATIAMGLDPGKIPY